MSLTVEAAKSAEQNGNYLCTLCDEKLSGQEGMDIGTQHFYRVFVVTEGGADVIPGADANGDGSVNALDITTVELIIAGLI